MTYVPIPYSIEPREPADMLQDAQALLAKMKTRRSCREFSDKPVSRELIESLIAVAHSAPSGANRKPWHFVAVEDPAIKKEIRVAAEKEERERERVRLWYVAATRACYD